MNIAIIPARGGSKRIPRKNIRPFAGKPMIAYAILAAQKSGLFDHIIVSSDDAEVMQVAREWGAETPFVRPAELADDYTPTVPVVAHAIQFCEDLGWTIEQVCCIYPCVPLIQFEDLVGSLELSQGYAGVFSFPVASFPSAIQRALKKDGNDKLSPFFLGNELERSQDLEPAFYDAGQFYWGAKIEWLTNSNIHTNGVGYVIPSWRAVDIDTLEDWHRAEILSQNYLNF
jgi:pseudaminic acid cytidylyltransferase